MVREMTEMSWVGAKPRFFDSRATKVKERAIFPTKKGRHTKHDLKELIKRSEKDYVDFQKAGWAKLFALSSQ